MQLPTEASQGEAAKACLLENEMTKSRHVIRLMIWESGKQRDPSCSNIYDNDMHHQTRNVRKMLAGI
jgi:hypothetical protein